MKGSDENGGVLRASEPQQPLHSWWQTFIVFAFSLSNTWAGRMVFNYTGWRERELKFPGSNDGAVSPSQLFSILCLNPSAMRSFFCPLSVSHAASFPTMKWKPPLALFLSLPEATGILPDPHLPPLEVWEHCLSVSPLSAVTLFQWTYDPRQWNASFVWDFIGWIFFPVESILWNQLLN